MAKQSKDEKRAAIKAYEKALDALENYTDGDGTAKDKKFIELNNAAHDAGQKVSWFRRNNW